MNELDIMLKAVKHLLRWSYHPSQIKVIDGEDCGVVEVHVDEIKDLITLLRYGDQE